MAADGAEGNDNGKDRVPGPGALDVVVVGGGAAGLAAATSLARFRHRVVLVDAGEPRNAPAAGVHNYLSRDGMPPAELLAAGRAELRGYGAHIIDGTVDAVRALPSVAGPRFVIELTDGRELRTRRVLAASGLVDVLPDVAGLAGRWGRDILHCPYCHGWEVRDQRIAVLATSGLAIHTAFLWRQLTPHVTLILQQADAEPTDQQWERLLARGISVVPGPAEEVVIAADRLRGLRVADGHVVDCAAVAVSASLQARAGFLAPLDLTPVAFAMGDTVIGSRIEAEPTGATAVPGVYVAGNVSDPLGQVAGSVSAGLTAAAAINMSLIEEDTDAAVAAARLPVPGADPQPAGSLRRR
ncbi:NAD(P)/FAD-dependent oxidoreductase [Rhizomonospora bruguierae]|uniref:NAD(P)/FAD-dependent oxidoreductase n=1 Tax=Rhizomonospora bruguierae TaxID=1581705 RepID=UPI001BCE4482|nr:NAD(P)/FAD-dependent oxidoreductase [Micromonospora sp. NBRC 107566]